ncbi:MAG: hypothetical protein AB7N71_08910 [Phycisphaerae bacterium]
MSRTLAFLSLLISICIAPAAHAEAFITVRLSYKVILRGSDGQRPDGVTEAGIDQAIADMNALHQSYGRGYRFVRVDPIIEVGGLGEFQRPSPGYYCFREMFQNTVEHSNMLADATANPGMYAWNSDAVNIYINNNNVAGTCVFPSRQLSVIGPTASSQAEVTLDEIGHYFNLCHTHGCQCGCCDPFEEGTCNTVPGDDNVLDTLPDLPCWTSNEIAEHNFGVDFADLSPQQQEQVRDVFFNIMSFHGRNCGTSISGVSRLTERQLNRWADAASTGSNHVCDGQTHFIDAGFNGVETGRSANPYNRVAEGLAAATGGWDILMIRGGNYFENLTISAPVTLRTPRGQLARIGQ